MNKLLFLIILIVLFNNIVQAQNREVGGPCQDCEALYDYLLFSLQPNYSDTLFGFMENEPKIKISGTVFENDGKTPASNIILYIYHVDRNGIYQPSDNPLGWEKRHGKYRGWLKTNAKGEYVFYTFRPAKYPKIQEPEHIHIYVKEPYTIPYYIDSIFFESDPMVTKEIKDKAQKRGGSGIVRLIMEDRIWAGKRDIILGLNIPNYKLADY